MTDRYDLGAMLFLGAFVVAPLALQRLERVKVRHGVALWLLGWCVGVGVVLRKERRPW